MMHVAVAGLGWWGRQICAALADSDVVRVVAAHDPQVELSGAGIDVRLVETFDELLADPNVDGIVLATPHSLHDAQVKAAAAAGKHVFCEKPLSLTAQGARASLAACRENGVTLGVGHERRYEPGLERIARMAADGTLGTIVSMDANFSHDKFKAMDRDNWRLRKADAPAGNMTALGIHLTDLFISLAGPVETVYARSARRVFEPPLEDSLSVVLGFHSGLTATFTCLSTVPFYGRITVMGEHAWAELRDYSNVDVDEPAILTVRTADGDRDETALDSAETVRMNIEAWARAAFGQDSYRFTEEELVGNIDVLEAITLSAERGAPVAISELAGGAHA
ncbi:Gfo/Idh/MocA family protein [Tranquillimonas rosea]|nr:Gfo/Idh/MocA family oxidoreductase [Tranquillimonas rosea]